MSLDFESAPEYIKEALLCLGEETALLRCPNLADII